MTAITVYKTQEQTVREHLEEGKTITPMVALLVYGISRLSSSIERLRNSGMEIVTVMKTDERGRQYGEYKLAEAIKIGSMVTVKRGHGYGLPKWVRRSKPSRVVGLLQDTAYVQFVRGTKMETHSLNVKELDYVA